MSQHLFGDWLRNMPIAHRGLHDLQSGIPENSINAFQRAIDHRYAIELDVRVCQDNEVIVFHDDTLERACRRKRSSNSLSVEELNMKDYNLFGTDSSIPLLWDVLKLVDGRTPLLIEIKHQPDREHANRVILNTLLKYPGPYAIQSFDPFVLTWFAKNAPLIPRGQISGDFRNEKLSLLKKVILKHMLLNRLSRPDFITYDFRVLPCASVTRARKKGLVIIGWTIGSRADADLARLHCENLVFEGFLP